MYFKWVDCIVCASHLNKTVIKKNKERDSRERHTPLYVFVLETQQVQGKKLQEIVKPNCPLSRTDG